MTGYFLNGETVMVCSHLYDRSTCKVRLLLPATARYTRFSDRQKFYRLDADGGKTKGFLADGAICCSTCQLKNLKAVDFIETVWDGGRAAVSDILGRDR
jgi:hypothetical protein